MNKMFLSIIAVFLTVLPGKSQTLTEGKVWNFVQRMYGHDDIERAYTVTVSGDTVDNGQLCKKLVTVYKDTPDVQDVYAVFEKDSKIYNVFYGETTLLVDFNLSVGDKVDEVGTVVSVDSICINNVPHKRITVDYARPNYRSYLVEGIGWSSTKYSSYELTSYYEVLVSVYENGECIFTEADFKKQATQIESNLPDNNLPIAGQNDSTLYDLSGRKIGKIGKIAVPQKGHIYIKRNKKFLQ